MHTTFFCFSFSEYHSNVLWWYLNFNMIIQTVCSLLTHQHCNLFLMFIAVKAEPITAGSVILASLTSCPQMVLRCHSSLKFPLPWFYEYLMFIASLYASKTALNMLTECFFIFIMHVRCWVNHKMDHISWNVTYLGTLLKQSISLEICTMKAISTWPS